MGTKNSTKTYFIFSDRAASTKERGADYEGTWSENEESMTQTPTQGQWLCRPPLTDDLGPRASFEAARAQHQNFPDVAQRKRTEELVGISLRNLDAGGGIGNDVSLENVFRGTAVRCIRLVGAFVRVETHW